MESCSTSPTHENWESVLLDADYQFAAFDGILYLCVKDVVVCYRCGAEHRGGQVDPARHAPFELTVHERYRQEKIRRERLNPR